MKRSITLALVTALSMVGSGCLPEVSGEAASAADDDPVRAIRPSASVLMWNHEEKLAGFPNYDRLYPTRKIHAAAAPHPLGERPLDVSDLRYEVDGESFGIEDFLEHTAVQGLLVIQADEVVLEIYRGDNDASTRWVSYSVAKSVVSLLVGAAIEDGYIRSVDQPVTDYLPLLEGSSYDGVTIANTLQMASGIEWNEDYTDLESDVAKGAGMSPVERLRFLATKPRVAPAGDRFNYNTGETHLVGAVLRAAIGNNLSEYLSEKIWEPFGMEADANWLLVEPRGGEHGGCCISATLRDYGRIGLFAMKGGVLGDGTSVLPEGWMSESTAPSKGREGYGYLWWLHDDGIYSAIGIFGQTIVIDPSRELVFVTHSAWPDAINRNLSAHRNSFFQALSRAVLADGVGGS